MTRVLHPRLPPRRGAARATTWWGKAWVRAVEEAAYAEGELRAARALARAGQVGQITVDDGSLFAAVVERDDVVTVTATVPPLDAQAAEAFVEVVAAEAGRIAALLAGDLPFSLVEHAEEAGVELLPYGSELETTCTCAAWADPCHHALAVLYQVAWLVEADPLVLLQLRGLDRETLLARLHARSGGSPGRTGAESGSAAGDDPELDAGLDAAARAARILELLDADPDASIDHLL